MPQFSAAAAKPALEKPAHDPAAVVQHLTQELRQPLGTVESIVHYLSLVLPRTEAKARRQLAKLQDEVRHMHWVLADALHYLQPTPPNLHLLDLTEVVSKTLSEWRTDQGASLSLRLEPDLPLIELDLEQVEHLLRNIAAFFGRVAAPGRSVAVRTFRSPGEICLEVIAEAPQCSADDLAPLFEPFGSQMPAGTGLALASARRIAEAHRARVETKFDPPRTLTLLISFPRH